MNLLEWRVTYLQHDPLHDNLDPIHALVHTLPWLDAVGSDLVVVAGQVVLLDYLQEGKVRRQKDKRPTQGRKGSVNGNTYIHVGNRERANKGLTESMMSLGW